MNRGIRAYLQDMLNEAERIGRFLEGIDQQAFVDDELRQYAVMYAITVLGEAARRIPDDVRQTYPDIPWRRINGMRNVLVHDYGNIQMGTVWDVARHGVPSLVTPLRATLGDDA